jgi:enterobactin synthetase component D
MTPFQAIFRLDLPHGRCVGVALPTDFAGRGGAIPEAALGALDVEERRHVETLAPLRRTTFVGGRLALRAALADLSIDPGAILSTARGAPRLPAGAAGSISHKDGLAVGLAAAAGDGADGGGAGDGGGWRLGVDIERIRTGRPDISGKVLRPEELARLPAAPDADADALAAGARRNEEVVFAFSAKEAIYKALDPFVQRYVSFHEVAVLRRDDGAAEAILHLRRPPGRAADEGPFEVQVAWSRIDDDVILTTARVRPAR